MRSRSALSATSTPPQARWSIRCSATCGYGEVLPVFAVTGYDRDRSRCATIGLDDRGCRHSAQGPGDHHLVRARPHPGRQRVLVHSTRRYAKHAACLFGLQCGIPARLFGTFMSGTATRADRTTQSARGDAAKKLELANRSTEEELDKAKSFLKGSYALRFDTSSEVTGHSFRANPARRPWDGLY